MDNKYIVDILYYMLKQQGIHAYREDVCIALYSSPNFPSLASISQSLSIFGVCGEAFLTDLDHLKTLKGALVHLNDKTERFFIFKEIRKNNVVLYDGELREISIQRFNKDWDGIILVAKGKNGLIFRRSHQVNYLPYCHGILIALALLYTIFYIGIISAIHIFLDILGLLLSYLLMRQHNSIYQNLPFCKIGDKIDCNAVINYSSNGLLFNLPLVGMTFFLFDAICLMTGINNNLWFECLYAAALIITFVLTCYQIIKIRKYCLYCISVTIVTTAIFCLDLNHVKDNYAHLLQKISIALIASVSYCYSIYSLVNIEKERLSNAISLLKIKRNPLVVNSLFLPFRNGEATANAIEFGNKNAHVIITSIISLQCRYCKEYVKDLTDILRCAPDQYLWRIYIAGILPMNGHKDKFQIINRFQLMLLSAYLTNKECCFQMLREWDIHGKGQIREDAINKYYDMLNFIRKMPITHYPTILINGRILPKEYSISDIQFIEPYVK